MKRLDFNKFEEADFVYMRLVHVGKQDSPLGVRERVEKEFAVMIDDLMQINLEYNNIGKQVLAIWQGYWMALSDLDVADE